MSKIKQKELKMKQSLVGILFMVMCGCSTYQPVYTQPEYVQPIPVAQTVVVHRSAFYPRPVVVVNRPIVYSRPVVVNRPVYVRSAPVRTVVYSRRR